MTWEPRYIVAKAPGVDGEPIEYDEPVLVIRGQDVLAPAMLDHYRRLYGIQRGADPAVDAEMAALTRVLWTWQAEHPDRVKVADR